MRLIPARPRARRLALALVLFGALPGAVLHPSAAHAVFAPTPLVVTSTGDSAICGDPGTLGYTLRCAINKANTDGTGDIIGFDIPSSDSGCSLVTINGVTKTVCKISPTTDLPAITANNVTINGYSQSGASPNTNDLHSSSGDNAAITIQLDGASDNGSGVGLQVEGSNNTIKGLSITNFRNGGIYLTTPGGAGSASGNVVAADEVAGDFVGGAPNGSDAENSSDNILVFFGSTANTIGGTGAGDRNVIGSGTGGGAVGVSIQTDGNTIEGNYLGTAPTGTQVSGAGTAVQLLSTSGGSNTLGGVGEAGNVINGGGGGTVFASGDRAIIEGNYIGTDAAGDAAITPNPGTVANFGVGLNVYSGAAAGYVISGNLISGIAGGGISLDSDSATVTGNKIGTDDTGTRAIPNSGDGIDVQASNVTIGGTGPGDGNLISGNALTGGGGNGIRVESQATNTTIEGNTIGVAANGAALGNASNGIFFDSNGDSISPYTQTVRANTIAYNGVPQITIQTQAVPKGQAATLVRPNANSGNGTGVLVGSGGYTSNIHVAITRNSIFENANHGIILDGQDPDACSDPSASTSGQPLCPVIDSATSAGVNGHAPGCDANTACTVEVFVADILPSDNNHGEGRTYLGSATTDSTGHWTLASTSFSQPLTTNDQVTATTTRGSASNNTLETSAFSGDSGVTAADATATSPADTATPTTPANTATPTSPADTATATSPADTATATSPADTATATSPADTATATSPADTATTTSSAGTATATTTSPIGGGGGPPSNTPELGSGELLATGLIPLALALLYRRRTRQTREHSEDTQA